MDRTKMRPAEAFRSEAEECRQLGQKATNKEDKTFWLCAAIVWRRLAELDDINERAAAYRLYGNAGR